MFSQKESRRAFFFNRESKKAFLTKREPKRVKESMFSFKESQRESKRACYLKKRVKESIFSLKES
jgi:hypothetical protein